MSDVQTKEITIVSIDSKLINYTDKKTGQPASFTLYKIMGNDGGAYETGDADWVGNQKIGDIITIKFAAVSKTVNGNVYTNLKLVTKVDKFEAVYARLDALEAKVFGESKEETVTEEPTKPVAAPVAPATTDDGNPF